MKIQNLDWLIRDEASGFKNLSNNCIKKNIGMFGLSKKKYVVLFLFEKYTGYFTYSLVFLVYLMFVV